MHVLRTIGLVVALATPVTATAQDDDSAERMARVEVIKGQIADECVKMNEHEAEVGGQPLEATDFTVRWNDDSIYDIDVTPEGRKATVVYKDVVCPNFGSGYCGSGGCSFGVSIAVPLGGYACKDTKGAVGSGSDPCYEFFFWNEMTQDFMSIRNELRRAESDVMCRSLMGSRQYA